MCVSILYNNMMIQVSYDTQGLINDIYRITTIIISKHRSTNCCLNGMGIITAKNTVFTPKNTLECYVLAFLTNRNAQQVKWNHQVPPSQ